MKYDSILNAAEKSSGKILSLPHLPYLTVAFTLYPWIFLRHSGLNHISSGHDIICVLISSTHVVFISSTHVVFIRRIMLSEGQRLLDMAATNAVGSLLSPVQASVDQS